MTNDSSTRVLVCASGSGGHLFPAKFVIEELKARGADVAFLGAGKPLEREILGSLGVPLYEASFVGVQNRGFAGVVDFFVRLPAAIASTWSAFRATRPQVIIGLGGYATVLPIVLGRLKGIPSLIHEAESRAGLANKVLAYCVNKISTAHEETEIPCKEKCFWTGHPVRPELFEIGAGFVRVDTINRILILGGSQGARALDNAFCSLAPELASRSLEVWHQCRPENVERVEKTYSDVNIPHRVMAFIQELPSAYHWSHIIVSRAGAGATSELMVVNRPAILVPFPEAQGDHQTKNAELLSKRGKALLIPEGADFAPRLLEAIDKLRDPEYFNRVRTRAGTTLPHQAQAEIAGAALQLVSFKR